MARRKKGRDISGWIVLDKPVGVTSTQAVARIKRAFDARKVGHAGTLDPLATGVLPIALGEATKTVSYAVEDQKAYEFTVRWGAETNTDDAEGEVIEESDHRPATADIEAALPAFLGEISQVPPKFSAIKINGARAYDLAREGETVELAARTVTIDELHLREAPDANTATFVAACGKGTYVRSLARDIGRMLGCLGHVIALRRTRVGPFHIADGITFEQIEAASKACSDDGFDALDALLMPIEQALDGIEHLQLTSADAARLCRGQAVLLRGRDAPVFVGTAYATSRGRLVALVQCDRGELRPTRVFNIGRG